LLKINSSYFSFIYSLYRLFITLNVNNYTVSLALNFFIFNIEFSEPSLIQDIYQGSGSKLKQIYIEIPELPSAKNVRKEHESFK